MGEKGKVAIPAREHTHAITSDHDEPDESESAEGLYYYLADEKAASDSTQDQTEDRKELVRIPTCAVFHKFAAGKGVPHSFAEFIRRWPALPQIVVSLRFVILIAGGLLIDALPKDLHVGLRPSGC